MCKKTWIGAGILIFAVGVIVGTLWQAYFPLFGKGPGERLAELVTQSGDLAKVVDTAGNFEVFYERPFTSPPALTFTNPKNSRVHFEMNEQRADGFKFHVSGYNPPSIVAEGEYPRWEAKGLPAVVK